MTGHAPHPFLARIARGPVLCDGAMGTQLYAHGISCEQGFEVQNLVDPGVVDRVHRSYLLAGAEVLETNTFGANALKLAGAGLGERAHDICRAGARLARNACEVCGVDAFVAGSVGPLGVLLEPFSGTSPRQARAYFRQVVEGLVEGGVDLILLETFSDLREVTEAVLATREVCDLPLVAQLTFAEDMMTAAGQTPEVVAQALDALGVDVIGANCGLGPQQMLQVIERMGQVTTRPLAAQPNAGLPRRMAGRLLYLSSPTYMADYAIRFAEAGARLVGGCCGTTPAHTQAMAAVLPGRVPQGVRVLVDSILPWAAPEPEAEIAEIAEPPTVLAQALRRGTAISVELSPPRGVNPAKMLAGAGLLHDAGVDVVNITDGAMARVRMSTLASGSLVQQLTGVHAVLHVTTRDRNLMALQSDLLGAHALGIRTVLALTGDPPPTGAFAEAKGVYDIDSIGLIHMLDGLNHGVDAAGNAIGRRTAFFVGAALNPTPADLEWELERFAQKLQAGAAFIMTQPVYDAARFAEVMGRVGPLSVPVLMGLMPLQSYRNAEFVSNELPGVSVPVAVLKRMRQAGAEGQAEGAAIAMETLEACKHLVDGVYIIPAFQRYEPAAGLVRRIRQLYPAGFAHATDQADSAR